MTPARTPKEVLIAATGRPDITEAIAWLGEGHDPVIETAPQKLLTALIEIRDYPGTDAAIKQVTRWASVSELDTSSFLFGLDDLTNPSAYRRALDALAFRSATKTLAGLTADSVTNAYRDEPLTMDVLALIAGLSPRELRKRLGAKDSSGEQWALPQIKAAWKLIDEIVSGTATTTVEGASPARPVELIDAERSPLKGWARVEQMRITGVPYEHLLLQRNVGGAWLLHRSGTSGEVGSALAAELSRLLDAAGIKHQRAKRLGGDAEFGVSELSKVTGIMTTRRGAPDWTVLISTANDSGSASKTAARLAKIVTGHPNVAVVVSGSGWSDRINDTVALATAVNGHLYSDKNLDSLVAAVAASATETERNTQ